MGIGQVVTLRVPASRLREVNRAIEPTAWGGYRTEFYPTYDYKALAQQMRANRRQVAVSVHRFTVTLASADPARRHEFGIHPSAVYAPSRPADNAPSPRHEPSSAPRRPACLL